MPAEGLDHIALTVSNVNEAAAFYAEVLGAKLENETDFSVGKASVLLLRIGSARLSLHAATRPSPLAAHEPVPGSGDFCVRWSGGFNEVRVRLEARGQAPVAGPVSRSASTGEDALSIYIRDPDLNLVELLNLVNEGTAEPLLPETPVSQR